MHKIRYQVLLVLLLATQYVSAGESSTGFVLNRKNIQMQSGLATHNLGAKFQLTPQSSIGRIWFYQRNYRNQWLSSNTYARQGLGERIGNQGCGRFAAEKGWIKISSSQNRNVIQGPDNVYIDPYKGKLRVLESKGGTSQLKITFGTRQGTNINSIKSAEAILRKSYNKSSLTDIKGAVYTIEGGRRGLLETDVIRTTHKLGKPNLPQLKGTDTKLVKVEAENIKNELIAKNPALAKKFKEAEKTLNKVVWGHRIRTAGAIAGMAMSTYMAWDNTRDLMKSISTYKQGNIIGDQLAFGMGIHSLKYMQSGTLFAASYGSIAAQYGWYGAKGAQALGKVFLPIMIVTQGAVGGYAIYEYKKGLIPKREMYKRTAAPAVFFTCVSGGTVIGGTIGGITGAAVTSPAGGEGAVPGAMAGAWSGAKIGAWVAIPLSIIADYGLNKYYEKFDMKQQKAVDVMLDSKYCKQ